MALAQPPGSLDVRRMASTLNEAIESGRKGQGFHVGMRAVAELATKSHEDSVLRTALVDAARKIFDETREIKQHQGGRTFDSVSVAHEREKILYFGLAQSLPMTKVIEPRDASHYTGYGVGAFVQAFSYSTPHLAALSADDLKQETATRTADNLAEIYRHLRNKREHRSSGEAFVLDQVLPLYNQVSGVPRLRTAVEDGVFRGVSEFVGRYGKAGLDAVRYMIDKATTPEAKTSYSPWLAKNAQLALSYHDPDSCSAAAVPIATPMDRKQVSIAAPSVRASALTQS